MEHAKFRLGSDYIEISGPETFVVDQLEKFRDLIETSYEKILSQAPKSIAPEQHVNKVVSLLPNGLSSTSNLAAEDTDFIEVKNPEAVDYQNVFVLDGDNFQITCDIPGNSISSKMISVVLIYMYAILKKGIETAAFSDLRQACMNAMGSEFDASNFSKCMDHNKRYFLLMGERQNRTAKLIRPGIKEAERLIAELNK